LTVPIHALNVQNFKGISDATTLAIRPLTIFIGPNSSGKSSGIHALAAMAQTIKLGALGRPLVLDDEFAQVHLGRFIEVVHSRSYSDPITLGIDIGPRDFVSQALQGTEKERGSVLVKGPARADYTFRCSRRTQEVRLDSARFVAGQETYSMKAGAERYDLTNDRLGVKQALDREPGFWVSSRLPVTARVRGEPYAFTPFSQLQRWVLEELRKTLYLGPFRQPPQRRYPTRGSAPSEVGPQGEATTTLLANEIMRTRKRTHVRQISGWLGTLGLGKSLDVARVGRSDLFDVNVTPKEETEKYALPDLGYGISQVLPVLTQCSFAPPGATLLFEQPELHLHQLATRPLMRVFIDTIKEKGAHVVAETHAPELFAQLLTELRNKTIQLSQVAVYRVRRTGGKSVFTLIDIDPDTFDVYDLWEEGLSKDFYGAHRANDVGSPRGAVK